VQQGHRSAAGPRLSGGSRTVFPNQVVFELRCKDEEFAGKQERTERSRWKKQHVQRHRSKKRCGLLRTLELFNM
jgi:hypothetical protein